MAILLLKKSYQLKDLKEIKFNDLWNSYGVFTTMRVIGKPAKILFLKDHLNNLFKSIRDYKLRKKNIEKNIKKIIKININKDKKYDHLFRVAVNHKMISVSLRKRLKTKSNFTLKLINYKRIDPEYKNLKYKKILEYLKKINTAKTDIALHNGKNILETGTSNLLFLKKDKIYSPSNDFYKGTTLRFFSKKLKKIIKKPISIDSINDYDEIIVIGSGKTVVSVSHIKEPYWRRKSLKNYRILSNIYDKAVTNCPRYNG